MWFIGRWNWDTCNDFSPLILYLILRWRWGLRPAATFLAEIVHIFQLLAWVAEYMWGPGVMSHWLLIHDRQHRRVTCWTMYQNILVFSQPDTDPYTVEVCWSQDIKFHLIQTFLQFFSQKLHIYLFFHFSRAKYPSHRRDTILLTNTIYIYT
jgi:hypothetical protein